MGWKKNLFKCVGAVRFHIKGDSFDQEFKRISNCPRVQSVFSTLYFVVVEDFSYNHEISY